MIKNPYDNPDSILDDVEKRVLKRHLEHGVQDIYMGTDESLFHPWVGASGDVFLKPLRFDVRNSLYVNILWSKGPGGIGRHRHRGPVSAYTLEGSWRYEEYDWLAQEGDFVQENPGVIHTLTSDTGMKTLFFVQGALDLYDEQDRHLKTMDVFSFLNMYLDYCEENSIPVNENLIF